jgi:hypothetical protein
LNSSDLGLSEGILIWKITALRQAIEAIMEICKGSSGLKTLKVGGLLGKDQKGYPSLVLASSG